MDARAVRANVTNVAETFAVDRRARQLRTELHRDDFDLLTKAGLALTGLPTDRGGLWANIFESTRDICELYRVLGGADSSVALVCSMHPAVLAFWLAVDDVPEPDRDAWHAQRDEVFDTVEAGAWWGTITSEPGSGGDVARSKTAAVREGDHWRLTGAKHFGSGSGITSYMLTTAVPEGDDEPDWFYVPVEGAAWDGSTGITLVGPWDGHGMPATQSHAFAFDGCPAERFAWPGHLAEFIDAAGAVLRHTVHRGRARHRRDGRRHRTRPARAEGRHHARGTSRSSGRKRSSKRGPRRRRTKECCVPSNRADRRAAPRCAAR